MNAHLTLPNGVGVGHRFDGHLYTLSMGLFYNLSMGLSLVYLMNNSHLL